MKQILKNIKIFKYLYGIFIFQMHNYYFKKDPKKAANLVFKKIFKRDIDWDNPKNLIEKNHWMQFNTDTTLWSECADKYLVRNYVEKHGFSNMLNKIYGHYYSVEDIDIDLLPKEFVLKPNNACEKVLLVKDKNKINIKHTKKQLKEWLKYRYGIMSGQVHYLRITPCIIAEEYLHESKEEKSLTDYKFLCFNGIPECVLVVSDRSASDHTYSLNLYDMDWNPLNNHLCNCKIGEPKHKPDSFDEMVKACSKLGENIPAVRIDFYDINGKPYFGEMTFTTGAGYYTEDYYNYLGSKIEIEKIKKLK